MKIKSLWLNPILSSLCVLWLVACGNSGSDDNGDGFRIVITEKDNNGNWGTYDGFKIPYGGTQVVQIDVPNLPAGESVTGFASEYLREIIHTSFPGENDMGAFVDPGVISIVTSDCGPGTGTPSCEKWAITSTFTDAGGFDDEGNSTRYDRHYYTPGLSSFVNSVAEKFWLGIAAIGETVPVTDIRTIVGFKGPHISIINTDNDTEIVSEIIETNKSHINTTTDKSLLLQVEVPAFLPGDSLTGYVLESCEVGLCFRDTTTAGGITYQTLPQACNSGSGLSFCEILEIDFPTPGEYRIYINAVDATVPVSNEYFTVTVRSTSQTSTVSLANTSITEGNTGDNPVLQFTVSLDVANGNDISFDYMTADGSATVGNDYESASGSSLIPSGEISATVDITVLGDNEVEAGNETVGLILSNLSSNATFANNAATGTIIDDDIQPDVNSLVQNWPIDTATFPPTLFLSPTESLFAGVAFLQGPYAIRWTVDAFTPDSRNTCSSCADVSFVPDQDLGLSYPDGANISVDQSAGYNFGTWEVSNQIIDTGTGLDFAGSDFFNVVVDPGAFQIIRNANWQHITLSMFGDMPGASRFASIGPCPAGEAYWRVTFTQENTEFGVDSRCIALNSLNQNSVTDWTITTGLSENNIYTATLRYVDGTPSNLGTMQFSRDFMITPP